MGETLIIIQQGVAVVATSTLTFLGTGSAGDITACRRLVFPSSVSPLLAPIVYSVEPNGVCINPTRTLNLDNRVLPHPTTNVVKTIGGSVVVRFEDADEDVIVTEIWEAPRGASMPTSFFRLLYDYLINADLIGPTDLPIQWEPRDRTTRVYNVEILSLSMGGTGENRFDVADIRTVPVELDDALSGLNTTPTGLVDQAVQLRMRIISEVV